MSLASTSSNAVPLPRPKVARAKKASLKPSSSAPPLGKFLASSEKVVRDKAVATLSRFLAGTKKVLEEDEALEIGDLNWDKEFKVDTRLAPLEMAKLWKGIFFCFWMSDKPLVQQALARSLALLTLDVRPKNGVGRETGRVERFRSSLCYLRGFYDAVVREWSGLDRFRLDKFYLLIRRFVHAGFLLLKRENWDPKAIEEYNAILTGPGGPLHVLDSRIPHSLCYHLADIYIDELENSISNPLVPSTSTTPIPLAALLQPFYQTLAIAPSTTMFQRVVENVFDPLFDCTLIPIAPKDKRRKLESSSEKPQFEGIIERTILEEDGELGERRERVGKKLLEVLFVEGGKKETGEVNRRRIYNVSRQRSDEDA